MHVDNRQNSTENIVESDSSTPSKDIESRAQVGKKRWKSPKLNQYDTKDHTLQNLVQVNADGLGYS